MRYAIAQLYDYRRSFEHRPSLALLVPTRPFDDFLDLLTETKVGVIWKHKDQFEEEPV